VLLSLARAVRNAISGRLVTFVWMTITLQGSKFTLLCEKALFKHDEHLLILADLHLGKASHFRRQGIPITAHAQRNDFANLASLMDKNTPQKVYFLGDLFHSAYNSDWQPFAELIGCYPAINFTLIRGNHDVIARDHFDQINVAVKDAVGDEQFLYTHAPTEGGNRVNFAGHIHPGIRISGRANQSVMLPCFYKQAQTFILPAFGSLTGLYSMDWNKEAEIFAVLPGEIRLLTTAAKRVLIL
jgi:uncharacterized protein